MNWIKLESEDQLNEIAGAEGNHVILKHNVTCPISKGVLSRLDAEDGPIEGVDKMYLLDLHAFRSVSDAVASKFGVPHESPQILLINNGQCAYHEWGYDISADAVKEAVA